MHLFQGPHYIYHPSTKRKIQVLHRNYVGNTSVEFLKLLDRSAHFYREIKASKEMEAHVLARYFTFGIRYVGDDPTPFNREIFNCYDII